MVHLVVVYGTLKRGQVNHHPYLAGARFVGVDRLHSICLYDLGDYPGARAEPSEGIDVEVFAVDDRCLHRLDELEEVDAEQPDRGLYSRVNISTRYGQAWIYLFNPSTQLYPVIRRGGWQPIAGTALASTDPSQPKPSQ